METQVYRMELIPGVCYETATYTRRKGNETYYTTHPLEYVGEFSHISRTGYGDGGRVFAHFVLDGVSKVVEFNYEGTTCFVKVEKYSYVFK